MMAQKTIDVSGLPDFEISNQAPLWWGQVFLCFAEGSLLAIMAAMYFYYRLVLGIWPPPGVQRPERIFPAISTAILLLSCAGAYIASEGAKQGNRMRVISGLVMNVILAFTALALRGLHWSSWNFNWKGSAYASITWGIMFLHSFDMVADLLFTLVLIFLISFVKFGPAQRTGAHVDSVVWYFLVAIWIVLYVTMDWTPYFWGGPL